MKTFSTSGTGNQQTLSEIESDKIPIYNSLTDAEADLANLEEGQIIGTKDEGSELSAPVDVVQSGNMHAVTSNAVAGLFEEVDTSGWTLSDDAVSCSCVKIGKNLAILQLILQKTGSGDITCYGGVQTPNKVTDKLIDLGATVNCGNNNLVFLKNVITGYGSGLVNAFGTFNAPQNLTVNIKLSFLVGYAD